MFERPFLMEFWVTNISIFKKNKRPEPPIMLDVGLRGQ
jgi:hypothetical protein